MNFWSKALFSFGLLGLLALMQPNTARADGFTWTDTGSGVTASGTLEATNIGGGEYVADSGTGTFNGTPITLYPGTDNGALQTSPSGLYTFDNVLYPLLSPTLDRDGLLFTDTSGDELNIYCVGPGPTCTSATGYVTSFEMGGNVVFFNNTDSTFSLTAAPEPGSLSLLLLGMLGFGLLVGLKRPRRESRVVQA